MTENSPVPLLSKSQPCSFLVLGVDHETIIHRDTQHSNYKMLRRLLQQDGVDIDKISKYSEMVLAVAKTIDPRPDDMIEVEWYSADENGNVTFKTNDNDFLIHQKALSQRGFDILALTNLRDLSEAISSCAEIINAAYYAIVKSSICNDLSRQMLLACMHNDTRKIEHLIAVQKSGGDKAIHIVDKSSGES